MPQERMIRITKDEWNDPRVQDWLRLTPLKLLRKTWNIGESKTRVTLKKFGQLELAPPICQCPSCTEHFYGGGKRHAKATSETEKNG
jgi:hypothetical protein